MSDPVTVTDRGRVRGCRTAHGYAFMGVPFAKAPFGPLRFRAPEPTEPWEGVRPTVEPAPTAPQPATGFTMIPEPIVAGGDAPECLSLNVWTPDLGSGGLPVLVWIHGGGFTNGTPSSSWYDGDRFARDGVVVVSIGYRLGAEGFLNIAGTPANRGVLDWISALEWVQRNAPAFGGDPERVTVAGQSAGGAATMLLSTLPQATGLFAAAIPMSGSVFPSPSFESTVALGERLARHLGISPTLADFERIPPGALVDAQVAVTAAIEESAGDEPGRGFGFFPFVDGEVVARPPMEAIRGRIGWDLPLLIGTTRAEFNAATRLSAIDDETAIRRLAALGLDPAGIDAYRAVAPEPGEQLGQAVTDGMFRMPALRVAEARMGAPAPTFHYEFAWASEELGGLGSVHCLDLPFVFDVLDDDHAKVVAGERAPQGLADDMHAAWVSFVTDHDPGWVPFGAPTRSTMVFDERSEVVEDLHASIRSLWR
jgi:para-nitrobenzyl esterase